MAQQRNPFDQFDQQGNAFDSIPLGGADPAKQFVVPKAQADLDRSQIATATDRAQLPYAGPKAAADARRAQIEADVAAAALAKAQREASEQKPAVNPRMQKMQTDLSQDELLRAIAEARQTITDSPMTSTGFLGNLLEKVGGTSASDLGGSLTTIGSRNVLDNLARMKAQSATGASGMGALSEKEGAYLRDSIASLGQSQSADKLLSGLSATELHYRKMNAMANGEDPNDPRVAAKYGIASAPVGKASGPDLSFAQGASRDEADPALTGVNTHIRGMIGAGKSADEITAYANSIQPGLGDKASKDLAAAVAFRAQNPRVPLSKYAVSVENRSIPMSGLRQAINTAAQSPVGTFAMQAGDAVTGGTLDNMTGNPALARAGMSAASNANPVSSVLGSLTGGALAGAGAEAAAGGMLAGRFAPMAADALYGAAYGAGSTDEGSRLGGAAQGAGVGVLGGMFGRQAARGAGNALTGVRDASVQYLRDAGVPMTLGQIASQSGRVGRYLKGREDRLSGFSGVGDRINGQRRVGLESFNRAAFNEGLAPIGQQAMNQTGEAAVEQADNLVSGAYRSALDGVRLQRDRPFGAAMQGPTVAANRLPGEMGENARYTLNERVGNGFGPNGEMTGNGFQQSVRGLEQDARAQRNNPYGNDFGNVTRGARGALEDLLDRQSPGSLPAYLDANAAYRNHSVLADATSAAMNTGGVFTPAQLGQASRANAKKFTGRISAATTDRPFFDLQRAGQEVLPSKVPDSGTAGRADAGGEGMTALARRLFRNARNAPLYSDLTQPAINSALLDRPDWAVRAGEEVLRRQRLGGMFGRPLALQYGGPLAVTPDY
jgi:hypothetical protein